MNIFVWGDNLTAWTMSSVLASTGCKVIQFGHHSFEETGEIELQRLIHEQSNQKRLVYAVADHTSLPDKTLCRSELLIYSLDVSDITILENRVCYFAQTVLESSEKNDQSRLVVALTQPLLVGTCQHLQQVLDKTFDGQVAVVYWPSFIQSGRAVESFSRPKSILIGCNDKSIQSRLKHLLTPFNRSKDVLMFLRPEEAELTKIGVNGMLATRISYMNELATFADNHGIDIEAVRQGIGSDSRIGYEYLYPGCGFGGKDFLYGLNQLVDTLEPIEQAGLLKSVLQTNEAQKDILFRKLWKFYQADIEGKVIAVWGGAFKPGTGSIYGGAALVLIQSLLSHGANVRVYDPMALPTLKKHFSEVSGIEYMKSAMQCVDNADAVMLVTEWKEFWNIDLFELASKMNTPLLLDGRNIFDPKLAEQAGVILSAVGRGYSL